MEKLWLIGNNFIAKTGQQYFINRANDSYAQEHFEIKLVYHSGLNIKSTQANARDFDDNAVSRIYNSFVKAMTDSASIPKLVVFILENDVIQFINYDNFGVTALYGKIIDTLARNINQAVDQFREFLPAKAKRDDWPQFIWIIPSTHANYDRNENALRKKFGGELENMLSHHSDMHAVKLKTWEMTNGHFVSPESSRITNYGLKKFWKGVDKNIKHANETIFDAIDEDFRARRQARHAIAPQ